MAAGTIPSRESDAIQRFDLLIELITVITLITSRSLLLNEFFIFRPRFFHKVHARFKLDRVSPLLHLAVTFIEALT